MGEPGTTPEDDSPRNIIVFIADGLGFAHLALAAHSSGAPPVWREFSVRGWHDPRPIRGPITDSAAAATAMATGRLTHNDRVGLAENGEPMRNLYEAAWSAGYRTGVVTDSYVWDATPASFVTHSTSRENARDILEQLAGSQLEVLLGELEDVGEGEVPSWEETIDILRSRFRFLDADLRDESHDLAQSAGRTPVAAVFPEDSILDMSSSPNLETMANFALERLADGEAPFLLLVESEEADSASHAWDADRTVRGLTAITNTVGSLLAFARDRGDTLVVFTSDHETGGLALADDLDSYPDLMPVWSSRDHTSALVPLLADGPGAHRFADVERVWEIGAVLHELVR